MDVKFKFEKFRDFDVIGVKICPFPLTLHMGLTTVQRYLCTVISTALHAAQD